MLAGAVLVLGTAAVAVAAGTVQHATRSHWRRVFFDGFRQGLRADRWGRYSGQPGGDPGGFWAPSHVYARSGILHLATYRDARFGGRWVSGGLSSARALRQTYGKYEVRLRVAAGRGVAFVALLWPVADVWPPEVDFAENGGEAGSRRHMTATLHWGSDDEQIQRTVTADFTRWHTLGVEWTPGHLRYTLDGHVWAQTHDAHVPAQPMELDLQTQAGTCGDAYAPCPDASTPRRVAAEVDWIAAWRWTGG